MDPLNRPTVRTATVSHGRPHRPTTAAQFVKPETRSMSAHDSTTALSTDAEQPPTDVRLTALRQALAHAGTITVTLSALAAALKDAEAPGIAWGTGYIADGVHALTSEIAELVKAEEEQTGPTRHVEGDPLGRTER